MVTLYVGNMRVDLGEEVAADLVYSLADIRTPEKRQVNYSKTMILPGTSNNNFVFGYIYDLNAENAFDENLPNVGINFNPKKLASAKMFKDGIEVFNGTLRLWKIVKVGESITYDVSLFGKLFDLFGSIGDKVLRDIDLSEYNHALSWPNIQANWIAASPAYRYPMIDFGKLIVDLSGKPSEMTIGAIAPCVYHKVILDKIFTGAGASYLLNFDTSIYDKILVTPNRGDVVGKPSFFKASRGVESSFPSDAGIPETVFNALPVVDTIDVNNVALMSGPNYTRLKFPSALESSVQVLLKFRLQIIDGDTAGSATASIFFTRKESGAPTPTIISSTDFDISQDEAGASLTLKAEIARTNWLLNEEFYINASIPEGYSLVIEPGSTITLISPDDATDYPLTDGDTYELSRSLPKDIKQVDFIKDFIRLFNLYVTQDPADPSTYIFTPDPEFYSNDKTAAKNWSNKIDLSQTIEITPISQITARDYLFTWKVDRDFFNQRYTEINAEVYGQVKFIGDTDVVTNEEKVESIFAPAVMQRYTNSLCITPAIYKVETSGGVQVKKPDSFIPRLVIWGGLKDAGHNIELKSSAGAVVATITQYPYAGHLDDPIAPSFDLNFGATKTDLPTAVITQFSRYWLNALLRTNDKDGKLLSCKMLLKPEDIEAIDFSSLIRVGNQFFRLNKIDGYNPFDLQTCAVELLKVV